MVDRFVEDTVLVVVGTGLTRFVPWLVRHCWYVDVTEDVLASTVVTAVPIKLRLYNFIVDCLENLRMRRLEECGGSYGRVSPNIKYYQAVAHGHYFDLCEMEFSNTLSHTELTMHRSKSKRDGKVLSMWLAGINHSSEDRDRNALHVAG
nr:hypothetical protein CFP56_02886 [Quercus suber]